MKWKTLEREYEEFEERLQHLREKSEQPAREHMITLLKMTQRYQQEIHGIDQQFRLLSSAVRMLTIFVLHRIILIDISVRRILNEIVMKEISKCFDNE